MRRRPAWEELPAHVRGAVEGRLGRVLTARSAARGFSPGLAAVLETDAGDRVFLKAVSAAVNAQAAEFHAREAEVMAALPSGVAPSLLWSLAIDDWLVLAIEAVDGRSPGAPWTDTDLEAVAAELARVASHAAPQGLRAASEVLPRMLVGWSRLEEPMPGWTRQLRSLEGDAVAHAAGGDALVHFDVRSDNLLLTSTGVRLVDWPHAIRGADWLDLPFFLPSVELEGGGDAYELFRRFRPDVTAERLLPVVGGWAGWLLWSASLPEPPALEGLRAFQAAQAGPALRWARRLLDG